MLYKEAIKIWKELGLQLPELPLDKCIFPNAEKLLLFKKILKDIEALKKEIVL